MYAFLTVYWLIFWQKFLRNPFLLSTSELASTQFPHWIWLGRKWRIKDNIYYKYPGCIPFLSTFYPPHFLTAILSRFVSINTAFVLFSYLIMFHYLLASFIAVKVMGLFAGLTVVYAGYCIKPQTPSFVYTMCWIPGMLVNGWFGAFSCGMAILGGYWPILVYALPVIACFNPICLIGVVIGLPQIIPFLWYWPRSVRSGKISVKTYGKLNLYTLKDIFHYSKSVALTNGVHYPESALYMGIAIFFIFKLSIWWIPLIISVLVAVGLLPSIQHIPCRALYLMTLSMCMIIGDVSFLFVLIQAFLLLKNSDNYPSFPFSQWWKKPEELYQSNKYNGEWPNCTGYLKGHRISYYKGAFSMKDEHDGRKRTS